MRLYFIRFVFLSAHFHLPNSILRISLRNRVKYPSIFPNYLVCGDRRLTIHATALFSGSSGHPHRNNLAPVSMQWAIRNREFSTRTAGLRVAGGNNLVFIDPSSLRRSTATSAVTAAQEPITMGTTASCLARAFGIVIRQIADLLTMMQDYKTHAPALPRLMEISYQDASGLQVTLESRK